MTDGENKNPVVFHSVNNGMGIRLKNYPLIPIADRASNFRKVTD